MPTDDIVQNFNELRQDIVLLYELKLALANCEYELQTFRHRFDTLAPGRVSSRPACPGRATGSVADLLAPGRASGWPPAGSVADPLALGRVSG